MPQRQLLVLLCAGALTCACAGCGSQHIVRASPPPSVSAPAVEENPAPPEPTPPPVVETKAEPAPEPEPAPVPPPPAAPAKRPAPRPRPAQPQESAEAAPPAPKPAPPLISPQLSPGDLAAAQRNTASNINEAQKNLQTTNGRDLNDAQKDLVAKVQGFLAQAQDAIHAEDWVRAANLADKARVLSIELAKGL